METVESGASIEGRQCRNCLGRVVDKNYCPDCGQKTDTHVLGFRELLEEIIDGLFNADSRIWRTLIPLATRPGKLTNEFLAGRRLHYLPPFRLYLILSVLFFLFPEYQLQFNDINSSGDEPDRVLTPESTSGANAPGADSNCALDEMDQDSQLTLVIRRACLNFAEDRQGMASAFADSIPVMMIIGLPLVALIMQMLYAYSGRKYLSHLIFLLHINAFYFLISIGMAITSLLGQAFAALFTPMDWIRVIAAWYIPVYMMLALHRVYGGSKKVVLLKSLLLLIGYFFCVILVLGLGAFITALIA